MVLDSMCVNMISNLMLHFTLGHVGSVRGILPKTSDLNFDAH